LEKSHLTQESRGLKKLLRKKRKLSSKEEVDVLSEDFIFAVKLGRKVTEVLLRKQHGEV
jgi:hypothetical protein